MANKYEKITVRPVTYVLIGAALVAVLFIILLLSGTFRSSKDKIYYAYKNNTTQAESTLSRDHAYKKISLAKAEELIDSGENILLFIGTPQCIHCVNHIGTFNEYFNEAVVEGETATTSSFFKGTIYYVELKVIGEAFSLPNLGDFLLKYKVEQTEEQTTHRLLAFSEGKLIEEYKNSQTTPASIRNNTQYFYRQVITQLKAN